MKWECETTQISNGFCATALRSMRVGGRVFYKRETPLGFWEWPIGARSEIAMIRTSLAGAGTPAGSNVYRNGCHPNLPTPAESHVISNATTKWCRYFGTVALAFHNVFGLRG